MDNEISSSALTVPPTTIGTSLIGLITNVINPTLLNSTPSKALNVKESVPLKFKSGTYSTSPVVLLITVSIPLVEVVTIS